jgi:hypothetical protein
LIVLKNAQLVRQTPQHRPTALAEASADREEIGSEVHALLTLKPGGRFFSIDPIAYNPVINVYSRMATKVQTEDESPLTRSDIALAHRFFTDVQHREFWIASLLLFVKYATIDRLHPNADRPPKKKPAQ